MLKKLDGATAIALEWLLSRLEYGHVTVVLPDNEVVQDGVGEPKVTIKINDWSVLSKLVLNASLAIGEGYMDGTVEIDNLEAFFQIVGKNRSLLQLPQPAFGMPKLLTRRDQISHHYDLSNKFFELFLDPTMMYSCAFFADGNDDLEQAQIAKIHRTLDKLQLPAGSHIVDIGCGWGTAAIVAARDYGYHVTAITLSENQREYAEAQAEEAGVADKVTFELKSFEKLKGEYDGGISIGAFEHFGRKSYKLFFQTVKARLKSGAPFLLHTITSDSTNMVNAWTRKWIFPKGDLPTIDAVLKCEREADLWPLDAGELLGEHYYRTITHWIDKYMQNQAEIIAMMDQHPWVKSLGKDGAWFDRMWRFWLEASRGGFGYGGLNIGQFLTSNGKRELGEKPYIRAV